MEQETKFYEAMFLVDSAKGGSAFPEVIDHIGGILERYDADIERIEKWDERELCYPVKDVEKGIYILTYFHMPPEQVNDMRDAVNLSEEILRILVLDEPKVSEPQGDLYDTSGNVIKQAEEAAEEEEEETEEEKEEETEEPAEAEEEETEAEEAETAGAAEESE